MLVKATVQYLTAISIKEQLREAQITLILKTFQLFELL